MIFLFPVSLVSFVSFASFRLFDFFSICSPETPGALLGVNPAQLVLYCAVEGDDPRPATPIITVNKEETLHKLWEITNRKAFKQTDYSIHYNVLPFPVFTNEGIDLRFERKGTKRFLDILVTDNRLRIWRTLFLDHLSRSGERPTGSNTSALSGDKKKRKTENVHNSVSTDGDRFVWPELSADNEVAADFMNSNKVRCESSFSLFYIYIVAICAVFTVCAVRVFRTFCVCVLLIFCVILYQSSPSISSLPPPQIYLKCHKAETSSTLMKEIRDTLGLPAHLTDKYADLETVFHPPQRGSPVEEEDLAHMYDLAHCYLFSSYLLLYVLFSVIARYDR